MSITLKAIIFAAVVIGELFAGLLVTRRLQQRGAAVAVPIFWLSAVVAIAVIGYALFFVL